MNQNLPPTAEEFDSGIEGLQQYLMLLRDKTLEPGFFFCDGVIQFICFSLDGTTVAYKRAETKGR